MGLAAAQAGCSKQSTLQPESEPARQIADLWWWMLAASTVVFAGTVVLLLIAWVRRARPGLPLLGEREGASTGLVLLFGMAARILPGYHPAAQIQHVGIAERHERARASALMRPLLQ